MRWLFLIALGAVACGGSQSPEKPEPPSEDVTKPDDGVPEDLVRLYLLSDVSAISPGQETRLAVRFDIEPSWHIYWRNPGEAGLPTTAVFEVPAGFTVGETIYPGPQSFDAGEGIISFGYHDVVLLSAPLVAPDTLPAGKVELAVRASWLACREMCIPGEGLAKIKLDVAGADTPSRPTNAKMFAVHDAAVPLPLSKDVGSWAWKSEGSATAGPTLEVTIAGASKAEYFPSVAEQTRLTGQIGIPGDTGVTLVLSYKPGEKKPHPAGVLAVESGGVRTFYQVSP